MKLSDLDTEKVNENSKNIDQKSTLDILKTINNEDKKVPLAIEKILPDISKVVDVIYERLNNGGRLIYIGAGTSGRLGVLDASECPPTYGVDSSLIQGLIAGGDSALKNAIEGAEDSKYNAINDLKSITLKDKDVVCGIAASGRTPYVIGGLDYARSLKCETIAISCVKNALISNHANYKIEAVVGAEVVTGSTRMKAGSAQKMILNMITTSVMIKSGKVYGNLMVDVKPTNEKLKIRALNIVKSVLDIKEEKAIILLNESDYNVKLALLMGLTNKDSKTCLKLLEDNNGNISLAMKNKEL